MKRRDIEKAQGLLRELETIENALTVLRDPGATKGGFIRRNEDGSYTVHFSSVILNADKVLFACVDELYEKTANELKTKLAALGVEL